MTKLEEVALAIHRARYPDAAVMDGIEGLGPTVAAQALVEARAAMGPLRAPTEEMAVAGLDHMDYDDHGQRMDENNKAIACRVYTAMIAAILNEKPGA